jgi:hypothetical protein
MGATGAGGSEMERQASNAVSAASLPATTGYLAFADVEGDKPTRKKQRDGAEGFDQSHRPRREMRHAQNHQGWGATEATTVLLLEKYRVLKILTITPK